MANEPLSRYGSASAESDPQMDWDDLRRSPAFPAIVGGLAGALVGGAMMLLMGRRRTPKKTLPAAYDERGNPMKIVYLPPPKSPSLLGFTPGDLLTLGTIGMTLLRQIQDSRRIDEAQVNAEQAKSIARDEIPPSPSEIKAKKK